MKKQFLFWQATPVVAWLNGQEAATIQDYSENPS